VIDEAGKMELFCSAFIDVTITQKGPGLIAQVTVRADVCLVSVTEANRDGRPEPWGRWVPYQLVR
jgi:hypothetical protein